MKPITTCRWTRGCKTYAYTLVEISPGRRLIPACPACVFQANLLPSTRYLPGSQRIAHAARLPGGQHYALQS